MGAMKSMRSSVRPRGTSTSVRRCRERPKVSAALPKYWVRPFWPENMGRPSTLSWYVTLPCTTPRSKFQNSKSRRDRSAPMRTFV
ncbi:hypothetical protein ACN28S_44310 [Cystobacter fuscus]